MLIPDIKLSDNHSFPSDTSKFLQTILLVPNLGVERVCSIFPDLSVNSHSFTSVTSRSLQKNPLLLDLGAEWIQIYQINCPLDIEDQIIAQTGQSCFCRRRLLCSPQVFTKTAESKCKFTFFTDTIELKCFEKLLPPSMAVWILLAKACQ